MAAGLPVVATDLPGNREALGERSDIPFCSPSNMDDLATRLLRLLSHPAEGFEQGEQNRQRVEKIFSIKSMCEKTIEKITELIMKRRNRLFSR